jgi:hypothetical protein
MGKRSRTSDPAVIKLEHEKDVALRSSERRFMQVASNTAAVSLLALRTEIPTALSEEAFPVNKPIFPLQPQRQAEVVKYSVSMKMKMKKTHSCGLQEATLRVSPKMVTCIFRYGIFNSSKLFCR